MESKDFDEGWNKDSIVSFPVQIEEPKKDYNIYFVVRNSNQYPFRNLILFTDLEGEKDTLYYDLADKKGKWLGSGLGNSKELTLQYRTNYHFDSEGEKIIKVQQAMRKDTLYGITDISVIVDKRN